VQKDAYDLSITKAHLHLHPALVVSVCLQQEGRLAREASPALAQMLLLLLLHFKAVAHLLRLAWLCAWLRCVGCRVNSWTGSLPWLSFVVLFVPPAVQEWSLWLLLLLYVVCVDVCRCGVCDTCVIRRSGGRESASAGREGCGEEDFILCRFCGCL
jgi:hypothetical protein